jgi:N-acetylglucosaminyldiphosphoundecaprenol N-acetyl-beta-D-mannosaminyltransferase
MDTARSTTFTGTSGETPAREMPLLIPAPQQAPSQESLPAGVDLAQAPKILVGDIPFTVTKFDDAVRWLLTPTTSETAASVRLANAYCVAEARSDRAYAALMDSSGVNLPDGTPVHWLMRLAARGTLLSPERVRGPSLFLETLSAQGSVPVKHFFLGGTPDTLRRLKTQIHLRFPKLQVAGMYSPPFSPISQDLIDDWADRISATGATIVWLGLGSPKQDFTSSLLARKLGVHCVGVGAAFDFLAGTQREAPAWMQRFALEWAYRLFTEPRRLWRRYLLGNAQFLHAAILRILNQGHP